MSWSPPQQEGIGEVEFRSLPSAWIAMCASRPIAQSVPTSRPSGQRPNQLRQFHLTRDPVLGECDGTATGPYRWRASPQSFP